MAEAYIYVLVRRRGLFPPRRCSIFKGGERIYREKESKFSQETSNFTAHLKGYKGVSEHHLKIRPLTSISKLSKNPKNDPSKSLDHDAHFPTDDPGIKTYF